MKRHFIFLLLLASSLFLLPGYVAETVPEGGADTEMMQRDTVIIEYTGRIKTIIDKKCYGCHSEDGGEDGAKEELLWDELPYLDPMDQVYILDAIAESVETGEMPPAKHVFWNPEKKLSREEAKLLVDWAKDLADKLYD